MDSSDKERKIDAANSSMIEWVKERIAKSVARHGSIEQAANALELEPVFVKLYATRGCSPYTPDAAELLVKLASDEQEVYSLWRAYLPFTVERWPQLMADLDMTLSECIAYEMLFQDNRYAIIALMAKEKGGALKKRINTRYGRDGLRIARLLQKLTVLTDTGESYKYDYSERTGQRWFIGYVSEGLVAYHRGEDLDLLEREIKGFEELKSICESNTRRTQFN